MSGRRTCRHCGNELDEFTRNGYCPNCLLREALAAPLEGTGLRPDQHVISGCRFGNYQVLEKLAKGGMGVVYKARQLNLNRLVAIKLLPFGQFAHPAAAERFRAEASAAAGLQHPNIVAIHEIGEEAGQQYYSMDLVEGRTLGELVRDQPLPARRAAAYVKTIAEAVHYAHQHGILHRDLKPSNVLIDDLDQPRITDFGLAKRLSEPLTETSLPLTLPGQVLGSPGFMAPEQAEGRSADVGPASDVYGLGALLYHLLTRQPPFQAETLALLLKQVLERDPVAPRLLNPSVPKDLEIICLKCLEKAVTNRYASALELAEDLGRFLRGEPVTARPIRALGRSWRWCRRQPVRAGLSAALLVVFLSGLTGVLTQLRRAEALRLKAERAEQKAQERLWESYLAQARANRWSNRAGRRFESLVALSNAAAIRRSLDLRNEAIACLALPDVRVAKWFSGRSQVPVVGMDFDPSFQRYFRADADGRLVACDAANGQELFDLPSEGKPEKSILRVSHDGRFLAAEFYGIKGWDLRLWDLKTRNLVLAGPRSFRSARFSRDSRYLVIGERVGTIRWYDLPSGKEARSLTLTQSLSGMEFAPDGKRLAIASEEQRNALILELPGGQPLITCPHPGAVRGLSWSPDSTRLACPCEDGRIYLWDAETGQRQAILEGHNAIATGTLFNHAGDRLVSQGWDGVTRFWDANLLQPLVSIAGGWIAAGFSPDDRRLGFGIPGGQFGLWEVATGSECRRFGRASTFWEARFRSDGRLLVTANSDGVNLWDLSSHGAVPHLQMGECRSAVLEPGGTHLIASGWSGVRRWNLGPDAAHPPRSDHCQQLSSIPLQSARLSADGHTLIGPGVSEPDVLVLDLADPAQNRSLKGHARAAFIDISPDGRWFATGTWQGSGVMVWSTNSWQPTRELPVLGSASCQFSPDGAWLVTGSATEYRFWRVGSWEPGLRMPRRQAGDMFGSAAFGPDGRTVALLLGRNNDVQLLSFPEGRSLANLKTGPPLCFSADGTLLATAGEDRHTLLIWDLALIRSQLRSMGLDWE